MKSNTKFPTDEVIILPDGRWFPILLLKQHRNESEDLILSEWTEEYDVSAMTLLDILNSYGQPGKESEKKTPLNLKWEIQRYIKGTVIEITQTPTKASDKNITVCETNFFDPVSGAYFHPNVKVKDIKNLAIFGSKQVDAILLQRPIGEMSTEEFARLIKKGGHLVVWGQAQFPHKEIEKFTKKREISELNVTIYERT